MTDAPNIGPAIGGLLGVGVMALAAKGVIDIVKEQQEKEKLKQNRKYTYREPREYTPRYSERYSEADNRIDRGLDRMLGRR
jgi:hypothetical protein